jgi:hypothetical protein
VIDPKRAAPFADPPSPGELEPLLELARTQLMEVEPRRGASSLAAVEQRLALRAARRRRNAIWRNGFVALAAAGCIAWFSLRLLREPLEMLVVAGELAPDGQLSPSSNTSTIRFSDGSELSVEPTAHAQVEEVSARGADIRLRQGQLRLQVTKRTGANWNVLAGAYRVHVTGTSLAVALAAGGDHLEVQLFSGSVTVSGPLIEGQVEVTRAQRLSIDGKLGRVRVEPVVASAADAQASSDAKSALVPPDPATRRAVEEPDGGIRPAAPLARPARTRKPPANEPSWSSRVAAGQFAGVLTAAERRGLDDVYRRANLSDLAALADAARYERRSAVARDALLAMRRRFPGSPSAKQAAFLLGRLVEDESAPAALDWYDRYLQEQPRGIHASQALGRKMLIVHAQRGSAAAAIAREYLECFPQGSYAPSAREIVGGR